MKRGSMEKSFAQQSLESRIRVEEIDFALESLTRLMQERTMFTSRELLECVDELLDRRNDTLTSGE